jgi:hypothetical protein
VNTDFYFHPTPFRRRTRASLTVDRLTQDHDHSNLVASFPRSGALSLLGCRQGVFFARISIECRTHVAVNLTLTFAPTTKRPFKLVFQMARFTTFITTAFRCSKDASTNCARGNYGTKDLAFARWLLPYASTRPPLTPSSVTVLIKY